MSLWEKHRIEDKVLSILEQVPESAEGHHLGRPFLTAYQIAIEFAQRYPKVVDELGWPVGGIGAGQRNTLAQYLARRLSQYVKDHPEGPIEGGFLSNRYLEDISFKEDELAFSSSLTDSGFALSMFRLREQ